MLKEVNNNKKKKHILRSQTVLTRPIVVLSMFRHLRDNLSQDQTRTNYSNVRIINKLIHKIYVLLILRIIIIY